MPSLHCMPVEYINSRAQMRFSALLRYHEHGDFGRFCHAADLAYGLESTRDKYFCANLLFASQLAGLCDVSTASGSTEWWVSHTGDICVDSRRPKEIGVSEQWFQINENYVVPVIVDATGVPLIFGKVGQPSLPASFFDRALGDILPAFKDIERQLCSTVFSPDETRRDVEVFRPATGHWEAVTLASLVGSHLVRIRDQYSGWSFFVQHSDVGSRVRITQPEWAFVVAFHLLPWDVGSLFRIRGGDVEIYRTVRLPALMCRALFAAASSVQIGPTVYFHGVQESCLMGLTAYFSAARGLAA
jgi:hypothetical protein